MAEHTIEQAAIVLGVSVYTVRRRIKRGELPARQDDRGRYVVLIDDEAGPRRNGATETEIPPDTDDEVLRLREENRHLSEVLTEVRRHRDDLEVRAQRDSEERAELRRLLGNAQMQLGNLLPMPDQEPKQSNEIHNERDTEPHQGENGRRPWWKLWG